jgi:hypothetical protein
MIYPYIKVNRKVVDYLGVADQRYMFDDGNYMLWKLDLLPLGGNNNETIRMIGGVGMSSEQVRAEQKGETVTPLPEAEDERFRMTDEEMAGELNDVEETLSSSSSDDIEETIEESEEGDSNE